MNGLFLVDQDAITPTQIFPQDWDDIFLSDSAFSVQNMAM